MTGVNVLQTNIAAARVISGFDFIEQRYRLWDQIIQPLIIQFCPENVPCLHASGNRGDSWAKNDDAGDKQLFRDDVTGMFSVLPG
ncbi:MAG: hypothetical protein KUL75_08055 [Sterolibacterium sp.]|nr:hypothetical protein [Sterolibacterium sp.]